jgi:hypothetical protein
MKLKGQEILKEEYKNKTKMSNTNLIGFGITLGGAIQGEKNLNPKQFESVIYQIPFKNQNKDENRSL